MMAARCAGLGTGRHRRGKLKQKVLASRAKILRRIAGTLGNIAFLRVHPLVVAVEERLAAAEEIGKESHS
jgi:hypothetical protein